MPTASEQQVPKPLTYTLMYHALWSVMFLLSAAALNKARTPDRRKGRWNPDWPPQRTERKMPLG